MVVMLSEHGQSCRAERKVSQAVWPLLDERTRRLMAASEARSLGYGGVSMVGQACGAVAESRVRRGMQEIEEEARR